MTDDAGDATDRDATARETTGGSTPGEQSGDPEPEDPLLVVEDLERHYPITRGILRREVGRVRAVDGVSFELGRGEALGLVGESGSGKTTTAHAVLGLEEPTGGAVWFDGERVSGLSGAALREFRRRTALVVQDPTDAFNPRMTVGEAVAEPLAVHGMADAERRAAIVADLFERVGLSAGDTDRYPHEFSGGEKQRIAIARALVLDPDLVVADEPTSALDDRVKADVLGLLARVKREFGVAVLFVSHDVDTVRRFCDRVAVMYLGELVERGAVDAVLADPAHPYTRVLVGSVPDLVPGDQQFVRPLTDAVPDPSDPPGGCRFHTRCPELVAPDDVDLPRETWQAVARLRFSLQAGDLPPDVVAATDGGDGDLAETVRRAFGLPADVGDGGVERAVAEAVERLTDGDREGAADRLAAATPTVCETDAPATVAHEGRPVACHRYDPEREATPLDWTRGRVPDEESADE